MRYVRVDPGEDDYLDEVWEVKESIRREDGFLRQTWDFFARSYTDETCHLLLAADADGGGGSSGPDADGTAGRGVAGFATVRQDGYVLFLGVAEAYQSQGVGRTLIERIAEDHETLTCHTRAGNDRALGFYHHLGFETKSRIDDYYQDGDAAFYLVRGDDESPGLGDRIASALRGDGD